MTPFIHSHVHAFIYLFKLSIVHSFTHSFIHSFSQILVRHQQCISTMDSTLASWGGAWSPSLEIVLKGMV